MTRLLERHAEKLLESLSQELGQLNNTLSAAERLFEDMSNLIPIVIILLVISIISTLSRLRTTYHLGKISRHLKRLADNEHGQNKHNID